MRDLSQAVGEEAHARDQNLVTGAEGAGQRHLHSRAARPEDQENVPGGLPDPGYRRPHLVVELRPLVAVVSFHRTRQRVENLLRNAHGAGDQQQLVVDQVVASIARVMPLTEVTTWSLEMRDRARLRPAAMPPLELTLVRAELPSPELGRFLYTAVGGDWHWLDRLSWTYAQWLERLSRPGVETWVAYVCGTPAGYFELDLEDDGSVEIAYFGLLPQFIGKGLGGWLLTRAIERAWELGASRVWVHTCSLDGPGALSNYQARGLTLFKTETAAQELAEQPPGPWPGARGSDLVS